MMSFIYARENFRLGDKVHVRIGSRDFTGHVHQKSDDSIVVEMSEIQLGDGHTAKNVITVMEEENATFWRDPPLKEDLVYLARQDLNSARDAEIAKGADTPIGKVDLSGDSLSLLNSAVNRALIAKLSDGEFTETWTLKDNSTVTLEDADSMLAVGRAVSEFISGVYSETRMKKEASGKLTKEALLKRVGNK